MLDETKFFEGLLRIIRRVRHHFWSIFPIFCLIFHYYYVFTYNFSYICYSPYRFYCIYPIYYVFHLESTLAGDTKVISLLYHSFY